VSGYPSVVFDLGNVLIAWDPHPAIAAAVGPERASAFLSDEAFGFHAWNHGQDAGRDWAEAEKWAMGQHPHLREEILAYRANFPLSMLGPIEGSVALLRELHEAGVPLFALTNWSAELFPLARERFGFLSVFEDIVVSGAEGMAKPDPEIFHRLAARAGGPLEGTVFIDDSRRNIDAARALGMDAVHFSGADDLRLALCERGFPVQVP
jgi:2-haloacid dehalogenase